MHLVNSFFKKSYKEAAKIKTNSATKNLILTAMFLAMGFVLPMLTGQIPQIGSMLLPMHIPVFLCALVCGPSWGIPMAFVLPLFRSLIFSRPNMYPEAISIAFEMASYALVAGILYQRSRWKCMRALIRSILSAMLVGRIVRCAVQLSLLGMAGMKFSFSGFFVGVIVTGIPGMLLQLVLIPAVMLMLHRTKLVKSDHKTKHKAK